MLKHCHAGSLTPIVPLGTRWLQGFIDEIGIASGLAYYGLTTLQGMAMSWIMLSSCAEIVVHSIRSTGSQTLGEEYVDILQYDARTQKIPTRRVCT